MLFWCGGVECTESERCQGQAPYLPSVKARRVTVDYFTGAIVLGLNILLPAAISSQN